MRVVHLFDWYLPSTLSWVGRLLVHLTGVQVEVAAPWIIRNQFYHPQLKHYVFPPQQYAFPNLVSEWSHPHWQRLFARTQRFVPLYRHWLQTQLERHPPDLFHAHFGPTGCLYLPLAQRLDRPLVVTFYGFDYQKLLRNRPVFRRKYRELFASAARVLAASPTGCRALEALGCPADKLAVVRPSPDLRLFPYTDRHKPPGQLRLVQVATFTEKKGHLTTLEAFRQALATCPNVHLTLAGERYDSAVVRAVAQYIDRHSLAQHIDWLGTVPHADMHTFLGRFDMFVHPSCTAADGDHEATPVVLLEAQATGLPVMATRHFDLPDEVEQGRTGWLVPERDAGALAAVMQQCYALPDNVYRDYCRQAREHVERHFTVEQSARQLENVYRELL